MKNYLNSISKNIQYCLKNKKINILLILGFIFFIFIGYKTVYDPDAFWHIKTGEFIVNNKYIPKYDVFSWYGIKNKLQWINHEWLFDILIYLVYTLFGYYSVSFFIAICSGILFLLIYKLCVIKTKSNIFSIILSFYLVLFTVKLGFISPRPQSISFCMIILLCILMEKEKYWWAIPIMIFESNIHGGFFPMVLFIIFFYTIKKKTIIFVLSCLAILINPFFYKMLLYTYYVQTYTYTYKYISEWQRSYDIIFLVGILILLVFLYNTKIKLKDIAFVLPLVILSFKAIRHKAFLYILIYPYMSEYIYSKISKLKFEKIIQGKIVKNSLSIVATLIFIVGFVVFIKNCKLDFASLNQKNNFYPCEKNINYIKENNLPNLFSEYDIGGYLIFNDIESFIDGRQDIFIPKFNNTNLFLEYFQICALEDGDYESFFNKYEIQYILINKNSKLYKEIRERKDFCTIYSENNDNFIILKYK